MKKGIFAHWPNRITAIRFVGALVLFGVFTYLQHHTPETIHEDRTLVCVAFWLFVVTAATDVLDGYLARRDHLVSAFGRIADPFTDKVLILGAMIYGAVMPWTQVYMPTWIVVAVLARELLVTGIRGYVEKMGGEFPADGWGKIKMVLQSFAIGGLIWMEAFGWTPYWREVWSPVVHVLVWATLIATLGSGLNYVVRTRKVLSEVEE
ncbi:MAG: CDP-diacylglycerol--glycerol-3-phosphate 3-phosphatidyltransferase [Planctomycetota bacterium]|jgi:CDP-diacylglycerol--glycerol-3-phosphate 3-phosphatidyltransferase